MRKILVFVCFLLATAGQARAEVTSKFNLDFYGFLKTDFIYADHGTATNEYRTYATGGTAASAFRVTSRATRLGVNISTGNISGKVEADFLGMTDSSAGPAGTTTDLRLRHAYVTVKTGKVEILAGQTYYPITADIPETLNDYNMGNSGDLYYRAPQLRATYSAGWNTKIIAGVVRPTDKLTDAEGTNSGLPGVQGKIEETLGTARVSLAGALGVWKSTSTRQTGDISALVAAFNVPWSFFTVYGEAWAGRNLYDFQGGLGNTGYGDKAVPAKGGYLAVKYKPAKDLWFNVIYGVDDPDNSRVLNKARTRNATALVNAIKEFYGCVDVGLEIAELNTDYKGLMDRSAMNYQFTFKLIF
jgi:hypothetical protein